MKDTTLFQEYVDLKTKINELLEKEGEMKEAIIAQMGKDKVTKVESEYGKFTIASRKAWQYSDKVEELSEKLKMVKHKEEERGIAKIKSINPYLVWTTNK